MNFTVKASFFYQQIFDILILIRLSEAFFLRPQFELISIQIRMVYLGDNQRILKHHIIIRLIQLSFTTITFFAKQNAFSLRNSISADLFESHIICESPQNIYLPTNNLFQGFRQKKVVCEQAPQNVISHKNLQIARKLSIVLLLQQLKIILINQKMRRNISISKVKCTKQNGEDSPNQHIVSQNIPCQIKQVIAEQKDVSLCRLYDKHQIGQLNSSKLTYYHSLVPKIQSLRKQLRIQFFVGLTQQRPKIRLQPQNAVNIHLFKPFYTEGPNQITCFVPTREVMKHAMAALFHVHHHEQLPQPIVTCKLEEESVFTLIQHWTIRKRLIICRVESLLTYLLIEWLKANAVDVDTIKAIALAIENSRLSQKHTSFDACLEDCLRAHGLDIAKFFRSYKVVRQSSRSTFLYGFNFVYRGVKVSAVMLPWGLELASKLTSALLALNPKIFRVGVVGGVGYVGESACKVDDIFVPTSILIGDSSSHYVERVENGISKAPAAAHFPNHTAVAGCLKSVFPEVGKLSNIAAYKPIQDRIDALDMEFEAIYRGAREHGAQVGAIYYIMDLPRKNIHLGDTYYSRPFLEQLFGKFERGKHHCFERSLAYLAWN